MPQTPNHLVCPQPFIQRAEELARKSAVIAERAFAKHNAVQWKQDGSPRTSADLAIERAMRAVIGKNPEHGVIGEEYPPHNPKARYVWHLDPIDGTKSFVTGQPCFVILAALLDRRRPILGTIVLPILKEFWLGAVGHPTRQVRITGDWKGGRFRRRKISSRKCTKLEQAQMACTSPDMFAKKDKGSFNRLRRQVRFTTFGGDGFNYALLAQGCIDLIVEADLSPHDYLALVPVITGSGGRITDWNGKKLTPHSDGRVLAAGSPQIHRQALNILAAP